MRHWDEVAARAARGDKAALADLGQALAGPQAKMAYRAARRRLHALLAPALAQGLDGPAGADCAEALLELGAPGLRAAWAAWRERGSPGARAVLLRAPDWLFEQLFSAWERSGAGDGVPYAELWVAAGLLPRLHALAAEGDPVTAARAAALLERMASP